MFTSSLAYDGAGRRTNLTLPNGVKVLYRYDAASRLTNLTYQAAVTNRIDYSYDDSGNRVAQASALAIYNLPSAISNSSYNAANQQTTFGSYTIQYDANGNVTNLVSGTTTNRLAWNARNQLTNVAAAVSAAFLYDGLGRRITRTVGGITEKYLYDGLDVIVQKDSGGTVKVRYFRGLAIDEPWQRIDVASKVQNNTNRVYLADALGSVVALTDTAKAIATEYDYEPFGKSVVSGQSSVNSYRFTAREDDGTGLMYYRARYYHPVLGRFVSEDPLEFIDGPNTYAYVRNNPIRNVDPRGEEIVTTVVITLGIAAAVHKATHFGIGLGEAKIRADAAFAYMDAVRQMNNRYGGNAPETVQAYLDQWQRDLIKDFGPGISGFLRTVPHTTCTGPAENPRGSTPGVRSSTTGVNTRDPRTPVTPVEYPTREQNMGIDQVSPYGR